MDLEFSEEQELLRTTVRRVCETHSPLGAVRMMERDERGYLAPLWQVLAEVGLLGLRVPSAYGGVELGLLEAVVSYEELGRALAPSPHFESAILAAGLLAGAGTEAQRQAWLPRIADGSAIIVPAWQERDVSANIAALTMRARQESDGIFLSGNKVLVPFANTAQRLLVLASHPTIPDRHIAALVDPAAAGALLHKQANHADATVFAVLFDAVRVSVDDCLGWDDGIDAVWERMFLEGQIALAAQAIGGAERMLQMTTEYAKVRTQFGRPIGGFQAIAHYLADRATEIEGAKVLVYQAAWAADTGLPCERLALMARLKACATFRRMTAVGTQIHGGIGFTSEADLQLYFRRAKQQQLMYGDSAWLETRIANCIFNGDLPSVD
ncbi:acyl-CoA dehydrogenase family protein [Burkholderia sp. BCC1993]|uniref:acyl-CoA dehydrogenase family protein n=1 Tax=Burkholderia sp. BCC1993 TaxID=2817444 RepID=UPI002AAF50BA|nr:acyl-CoA dehydrogenase family protein [Burkholderia sp. BCC1993]